MIRIEDVFVLADKISGSERGRRLCGSLAVGLRQAGLCLCAVPLRSVHFATLLATFWQNAIKWATPRPLFHWLLKLTN